MKIWRSRLSKDEMPELLTKREPYRSMDVICCLGTSGKKIFFSYPETRDNELRERIPVPHENFFNLSKVRARAA